MLEVKGIITHEGTIVDAPRQRNSREDNLSIKNGETPQKWLEDTLKAKHKLVQKDMDARWTTKNNKLYYRYKDHAKVDSDSKIITDYAVTTASVHDRNEFLSFITKQDKNVYGDSAYVHLASQLPEGVTAHLCEKGYRGRPLSEEQKKANCFKSKIRCRIEHVFGFMTGSMNGITVRSIGIKRAEFNIGQTNLVYNLCRYSILERQRCTAG